MAEVFYFHVQEDRSIKYKLPEPIMQEDKDVATWRFRIPKVLNNIDMSAWAWWFVYVNAKNQKFSELLTLGNDIDDPDNYCTADYPIGYGISKTPGGFTFALEAINASQGGEISGEWHTRTYTHTVTPTLQGNQAEYTETESDVISALMQEVRTKMNQVIGGATPLPVNLKSLMTDPQKVYLYTGSETGESTGYWYYYNGTQFVPGGLYASGITIDPTLSQSGQAADAKKTGDEITALKEDFNDIFDPNPTKNLFNKNTMTDNLLIDDSGVESVSALYVTSDYIKLPVKAVTISSVGTTSTTYKYRIAIYDKNKVWKYRQLVTTDDYMLAVNTSVISTSDEYYYIRISFEKARGTDYDTVQVEVGATKTAYVPHLMPLDYNGRVLIGDLTDEVERVETEAEEGITEVADDLSATDKSIGTFTEAYGVNLFDPTKLIKNTLIDGSGVAMASTIYDSSDFIPIQSSAKIIRAFSYTGAPTYRVAFYDSSKNFLFRNTAQYSLWADGYAFAITSDCAYARISIENENNTTAVVDPYSLVFANGNTMTEFVPYLSAIDFEARENIEKYGAEEHIKDYSKTDEIKLGLSFHWSGNTCYVTGRQATALCTNNILDSRSELPEWMETGQTLYVDVESTKADVRFNLAWYLDSGNKYDYFTENSFVTVPDNAVGVIIRLSIPSGSSIGSASIKCNLFTAGTNPYLSKIAKRLTDEFERRVGTVDDASTPMLTIIDDDGNSKFYTDLYPIAVTKNVPIASAVPYSFIGTANHVTQAQLLEMYANGIEILSHTYSHMYTQEATEQEYERDYQKAKNSYSLIGIQSDLLVYAGGSANAANAQEAAKRVYIGAFNSGKEHTNFSDKNDKYNLERYGITDSNDDGRIDGTDLNELKALIDNLKQTGGWMVWMTHTSGSYWGETMKQNIADVIDYAIEQNIAIVTASYGFRKYFGV